jgi:hypothetical protein
MEIRYFKLWRHPNNRGTGGENIYWLWRWAFEMYIIEFCAELGGRVGPCPSKMDQWMNALDRHRTERRETKM